MILYIIIQSGLPRLNINTKIGIWIPQKTTRNDSGLNDIEGLPYIIIQSGLPRLNIIRSSKKEIFPKKTVSEIDSCDIEGLPYIIIQSGLPRLNINKKIGIVYRGEQVLRLLL